MCKIGDIILIPNPKVGSKNIGQHPFIVLSDQNGTVGGMYEYDFICLLTSSMENEEKREKMLKYPGNFPITKDDKQLIPGKINKDAFVKADSFFYFSKEKIKYSPFGTLNPEIYNLLIEFIEELSDSGIHINQILDKAKQINDLE